MLEYTQTKTRKKKKKNLVLFDFRIKKIGVQKRIDRNNTNIRLLEFRYKQIFSQEEISSTDIREGKEIVIKWDKLKEKAAALQLDYDIIINSINLIKSLKTQT